MSMLQDWIPNIIYIDSGHLDIIYILFPPKDDGVHTSGLGAATGVPRVWEPMVAVSIFESVFADISTDIRADISPVMTELMSRAGFLDTVSLAEEGQGKTHPVSAPKAEGVGTGGLHRLRLGRPDEA